MGFESHSHERHLSHVAMGSIPNLIKSRRFSALGPWQASGTENGPIVTNRPPSRRIRHKKSNTRLAELLSRSETGRASAPQAWLGAYAAASHSDSLGAAARPARLPPNERRSFSLLLPSSFLPDLADATVLQQGRGNVQHCLPSDKVPSFRQRPARG